ncbi:MAG: hypothetical protein V2J24_20130 [Pseudomonadales bacterium]|jgi:hypothetical protein|nr:hypothetical protein [Pseudomonadales bacterium]
MTPDELRDDIPADVREALAELANTYGGMHLGEARDRITALIRKRPATVVIPRAEIPAPLEEVPESGVVWVPRIAPDVGIARWVGRLAQEAVAHDIAYGTEADARRALDAMMAREPVEEEPKADDRRACDDMEQMLQRGLIAGWGDGIARAMLRGEK